MLLPATTRGFLPLRASHTIKSMSRMTTIGLQALLSADSSASAQIQSATRGFGSPISSRLKVKAYVTSSAATRPFSAVNPSAAAPVMAHPRGYSTEATDSQQSPCGQSSEAAPKPPVQIVSNLLCMPDPDAKESWDGKGFKGLKVALFQRSESVSVYRGKYALISGKLHHPPPLHDSTPLAGALRELAEETTLTASDVSLIGAGTPYAYHDADNAYVAEIHNFAWLLKPGAEGKIQLEQEHVGMRWVRLEDLAVGGTGLDTVPLLERAVRAIWGEV